jgi:hypothetical protein
MFIFVIQTLQNKWNEICMKQLAGGKHIENDCIPRTLKFEMQFLPLTLTRDVMFELPLVDKSILHSHAKLMHGMDKHHEGHAWTKTITSHIKNDMNLTFRTSTCEGHLCCENQDCKYNTCIYCTYPVNEMEWDAFILMTFCSWSASP